MARSFPEPPKDTVMNAVKQEVTNDTVGWIVPTPREGHDQLKLWVYLLKLHMTEEAWGALNSPHLSLSSLMRKLGWLWKSWVNKFYSLFIWLHITLFSCFCRLVFLSDLIVVGVDVENIKSETSLLPFLAILKLSFLYIDIS
jgi:hypothetical protein